MYKRLLASTALVAAGMVGASAAVQAQTAPASQPLQVTVGGYFEQTFGYGSNKDGVVTSYRTGAAGVMDPASSTTLTKPNKWQQNSDSEIWFNIKGTLANGITVGARVELEANSAQDTIDESFLFVEGAFGRLEMGTTDEASYKTHVGVPGIGKAYGIEQSTATSFIVQPVNVSTAAGTRTSTLLTGDAQKIAYYTPRFEGLQVGVSLTPNAGKEDVNEFVNKTTARSNVLGVGANFTRAFGGVNVEASLGWAHAGSLDSATASSNGAEDFDHYTAGLRVGFAGFTVGGGVKSEDNGQQASSNSIYAVGVSYAFGPATVGIQYLKSEAGGNQNDGDDKYKAALVGANYTLGPGVDLFANIFNLKWTDESSTAAADNNKGTGAVAGLRLTF